MFHFFMDPSADVQLYNNKFFKIKYINLISILT